MTDTRQRAAELVADAFAKEQDYYTMDDLLEYFDMPNFEPDARLRAEKDSDAINFHSNDESERRGMINLSPQGLQEAMTVMFDERLQAMTAAVVDRHRLHESNDTAQPAFDYRIGCDNTELPAWDRHDPKQANVIRGLVASDPSRLYVLRGKFGASDLLRMVYDDGVESACGLNYSPECDPMATPPSGGERWQRRWAVFPVPHGEYLVYFTICAACYFDFWHTGERGTSFVSFDPKYDADESAQ